VGNGIADDTAALLSAVAAATAQGKILTCSKAITCKVTGTITLACNADLSLLTLTADGTIVSPVVRLGDTSIQYLNIKEVRLPDVQNTTRVSGQFGHGIGVEISHINECIVYIGSVAEFEQGVWITAYTHGTCYNTFYVGDIESNKENLVIASKANTGWVNENTYICGRITNWSDDFSVLTGSRYIVIGSLYGQANNNRFIGNSLEGANVEYTVEFRQNAAYNIFYSCRWEASPGILFNTDISSGIVRNIIFGGYNYDQLTFNYAGIGSSYYNTVQGGNYSCIDGSGSIINLANESGTSYSYPHIQGFAAGRSSLGADNTDTDWTYRLHGFGLSTKQSTDPYPAIDIKGTSYIYMGDGSAYPVNYLRGYDTNVIRTDGHFVVETDNTYNLGAGGNRWAQVYAGTGTINTSDEREKQDIAPLDETEKRVAVRLKALIKKFRFKDAVTKKGVAARIHVGVIAQEVIAAFQAEGLNALDYACVCHDAWDAEPEKRDEDGNILHSAKAAGDRYGVRYEELIAFIISAL
jgi:hypothetical protein